MALSTFARKMLTYKGLTLLTAPLAVVIAAGAVMGSSAALSGTTENSGNTWATASTQLSLGNSNTASAMFNAQGITGGYTETHCITITNTSPQAATVKAFGTNLMGNTALSDLLVLNVDSGTAGTDDGLTGAGDHCTNFVNDAAPAIYNGALTGYAQDDYSTAFGAKTLAVNESVTYKVTTNLPAGTNTSGPLEGIATGIDFTWEIQG